MIVYQRIIADIIQKIKADELKKGDKLSSIRELSKLYHCSKDTVIKALTELKYQDYLYVIPKSGYYVLGTTESKLPLVTNTHDFSNSMPDSTFFPYDEFRHAYTQAIKSTDQKIFTYFYGKNGLPELVTAIRTLLIAQQVHAPEKNIIISTGIQQALFILSKMKFPSNKEIILLEQPTYHMMNQIIEVENLPVATISRDKDNLNLDELEAIFKKKKIKFFYTIPRFHNPLGTYYTDEEKKAIVALAKNMMFT